MAVIKVVITGASGKMAKETLLALCKDPDAGPRGGRFPQRARSLPPLARRLPASYLWPTS